MKIKTLLLFFAFGCKLASAQIVPVYFQNFDSLSCTGWTHYALEGTDNWERGIPNDMYLNDASTSPNVWATDLDGPFSEYSVMVLETPSFDLSDMTKQFLLGFAHQIASYSYHGGNIDYSTDNGVSWQILNGTATEKVNWYTNASCSGLYAEPTWSYNSYSSFTISTHNLAFLQGYPDVKFRFKFGGTSNATDGWVIDNFSIIENTPNIRGSQGVTYKASKYFPNFDVVTPLLYTGTLLPVVTNTTNYYFSRDAIFDAGDSLLGSKSQAIISSVSNFSKTFSMIPNLHYGDYYIFCQHDATNNLIENIETDNVGYCILHIDSTFIIPEYVEDFEDSISFWNTNAFSSLYLYNVASSFLRGDNTINRIEHAHSGVNSWHTSRVYLFGSDAVDECLESPYLDLTAAPNNVVCFWYKAKLGSPILSSNAFYIELSNTTTYPSFTIPISVPSKRLYDWDCHCASISALNGANNAKLRFRSRINSTDYVEQLNIDDVYIGQPKPDLSIEHINTIYTPQNFVSDTLFYDFSNSGLGTAGISNSKFYWSTDSLYDAGDMLIADFSEPAISDTSFSKRKVIYTKPTLTPGTYYIFYFLDAGNSITEMREYNNSGFFKLIQDSLFTLPYSNDFETQTTGWFHNASIGTDDWICTSPVDTFFVSAFSGSKAWITKPNGIVTPDSRMHLYTPSFDFSTLSNPVIEFDMKNNIYNKINLHYSTDGGASWKRLDTVNKSFNRWYYWMKNENWSGRDVFGGPAFSDLLYTPTEYCFASTAEYNTRDAFRNTRYILDVSRFAGMKNVKFRYNMASGPFEAFYPHGAMIDNFTIRDGFTDLRVNEKKQMMISSLSQQIKFFMHIKNSGNIVSAPSIVKYYLSADTLLDGSDFYLGQDTLAAIRPDMTEYVNDIFNAPSNLSSYTYMLYELDATSTNAEQNEINNVGNWPLALDSVSSYPYMMDFNDTIVHGWTHYEFYTAGSYLWRFRNQTAPGEEGLHVTLLKSGQMFTEMINTTLSMTQVPYMYLETPAFNFSGHDSIDMMFDLMVIGRNWSISLNCDGANIQYTTDGGANWIVLDQTYPGQAYNWYTNPNLIDVYNQPGWDMLQTPGTLLDSVYFNLSFLRNQPNVVFRYQFRSKSNPTGAHGGMRLDNFKIQAYKIDYIANDSMSPILLNPALPNINANYSITNTGQENGRPTFTKFYWSADSLLDINDSLILTTNEGSIPLGNTLNAVASINYPLPLTQNAYYLFYFTDADSNLVETNENNNIGSFKITVPLYVNYEALNYFDTINAFVAVPTFNVNYSILNSGLQNGIGSQTKFFWSTDNIQDISDPNIQTITESSIVSLDTLNSLITITYPTPVTQSTYHLFYSADGNSSITESYETDNSGSYVINFDYNIAISENENPGINLYVSGNIIYIEYLDVSPKENYTLSLVNSLGQTLSATEIKIEKGLNRFNMPEKIASGIYMVVLKGEKETLLYKTIIQN